MLFINMALVVLTISFDFTSDDNSGYFPIFNGEHKDLDVYWYGNVAKIVSFTLMISIFSPLVP